MINYYKKKYIYLVFALLLLPTIYSIFVFISDNNNYTSNKIILGNTKSNDIPWLFLETSHIAYDENQNIYVLNKILKKIHAYNNNGQLSTTISLKNVDFTDKSEELGDEGYILYQLQVSSEGDYFYITEGGIENNWSVFDRNGLHLKKNIKLTYLKRKCNNIFLANKGLIELDSKLNIIKKNKILPHDDRSSGNNLYKLTFFKYTNPVYSLSDKQLNELIILLKDFRHEVLSILGTDGENNIYLLTGSPLRIIKISTKYKIDSVINIPNDNFFREWRLVEFTILCNGTIYATPSYFSLWNPKERKASDTYYVYKFEMKLINKFTKSIRKFF